MRALVALIGSVSALAVLTAAPAGAHGPCGCLDPRIVEAGSLVRLTDQQGRQAGGAGYPAYRVVFNPARADLGIAPSYLASAHRPDAPTTTVLSRSPRRPTRRGRFEVPRATPPGLYMVLIFDGEEGGAHNTWDYLHVVGRDRGEPSAEPTVEASSPTPSEGSRESSAARAPNRVAIVGAGVGALLLGAILGAMAMRSRSR
ncbi:MAG: hypothetical protein AVDCRST_MAG69-1038 [uncultured Solirubrobacteraceae bacterium]|uniref:CopC domain-containing protein n=1 Tax=uncultured Solirubrobacteraceae bacterium TaxID=1162706 RepID=A0A6J4S045_9ACTN|nr:MAG: hypothetical protein AVDCRST_MAG69-1038 [uncultured Solirubrobacteraceae bacterium]